MIDTVKRHPWYASIVAAVALYAVLGFLLAPYLLQQSLVQTLQRDFDAELRVDNIEINPFRLSLQIDGLELDNPQGAPTARVGQIFVNLQLSSIFRRALTFDEIRISTPQLFINRDQQGAMDFAYLTQANDAASAPDPAEAETDASPFPLLIFNFRIEDGAVDWSDQSRPEPVNTRFGPIDIAIRELNTLPDRSGQQQVVIVTETTGTLSLTGELQLNPLRAAGHADLQGSRFPLTSAYIRHQTGLDIVDGSADADFDYEILTTDSGEIAVRISSFNQTFSDVTVNSFSDGTGIDFAGPDQQILKLPQIRIADGRLQWPEQTIQLGSISIEQPQIDVTRNANGEFNLEPRQTGAGAATDTEAAAGDDDASAEPWQVVLGQLSVNGLAVALVDQTLTPEARLGITDFDLSVSDISNQPGKRFPSSLSWQLSSGGRISLQGDVGLLPQPRFELDVKVDNLLLAGAQPYIGQQANLSLDSGALSFDGHASGSDAEPLSFDGDLEVADFVIAESITGERLASWQKFNAEKIAFSLAARRLDISRLRFGGLYGDILIDEDGRLNLAQVVKRDADSAGDSAPAQPETANAGAEPDTPFELRIGEIVLTEASSDFSDLSLPLPFAVKIDALNGKMTTVSTASNEASEVSFEGKIDEFGLARIDGTVTPLQPADNTDIRVSLQNIDVPKFTPYSIPFAGRKIDSGKMDLKLGYRLQQGRLVGDNSIVLRDFELGEEVPHPGALDLPLGLAVALLKDASGKIDIDLQVSGDAGAPEFDIGDVIVDALGKLLSKIVLSPFAALGKLLGIEASQLEKIEFIPGRSDLTPPQLETAANLARALAQRPELKLVIGGVYATEADAAAMRDARLADALAQRIADLVAAGDAPEQLADQRRLALEQMYGERLATGAVSQPLDELRLQFTAQAEGQAEPEFDRLAYANALRARLIELQELDGDALQQLASARAAALKTALLALDANLGERIETGASTEVTAQADDTVEMKITLTGKSG